VSRRSRIKLIMLLNITIMAHNPTAKMEDLRIILQAKKLLLEPKAQAM